MTTHLIDLVMWFKEHTNAELEGIDNKPEVGAETIIFRPRQRANSKTTNTLIKIKGSAKNKYLDDTKLTHDTVTFSIKSKTTSAVITLQTILPLLLLIGNFSNKKVDREFIVKGPTNCPESPSFEYLDQVFAPALKDFFGINITCKLEKRGWGFAPVSTGAIKVMFTPLPVGSTIKPTDAAQIREDDDPDEDVYEAHDIVATIVAPSAQHKDTYEIVSEALAHKFGYIEGTTRIDMVDNQVKQGDHVYVLLVVYSQAAEGSRRCRWARHWPDTELEKKTPLKEAIPALCKALEAEVERESPMDHYLQDQLVVWQALAEGTSSFRLGIGGTSRQVEGATAAATKLLSGVFTKGKCTGGAVVVGEGVKVEAKNRQELEKQA